MGKDKMVINEQEQKEILGFDRRFVAIDEMFHRCMREQESWSQKRDEWFTAIRKKYSISDTDTISIDTVTREITIVTKKITE